MENTSANTGAKAQHHKENTLQTDIQGSAKSNTSLPNQPDFDMNSNISASYSQYETYHELDNTNAEISANTFTGNYDASNVHSNYQHSSEVLTEYINDSATLQRLCLFIRNDFDSYLTKSENSNPDVSTNLSQLEQNTLGPFSFMESGLQAGECTDYAVPPDSTTQKGDTNSGTSVFDKLKPVIEDVASIMAILGGPNHAVRKKVITTFGKKFFDVVFDDEEIRAGTANTYDPSKVCMVARCIAWVISHPDPVTIETFIVFDESFDYDKETGLSEDDLAYFKDIILVHYAGKRRAQISKNK